MLTFSIKRMMTQDETNFALMNAEILVKLMEEMMDLKVQQHAETHLRTNPEVARLLMEKRETDRRRLEQLRAEMARLLKPLLT